MTFKFEQLDVWQLALENIDLMYELADKQAQSLAKRLHAFRKALSSSRLREESAPYEIDEI